MHSHEPAAVIDPRREAILVARHGSGVLEDRTRDVDRYAARADGTVEIVFTNSSRPYPYRAQRVRILGLSERVRLARVQFAEVDGVVWETVTEVCTFRGPDSSWTHVFYRTEQGEAYSVRPASRVRIISSATVVPRIAGILNYWRDIVARLPADSPFRPVYDSLNFVHQESALGRFLAGAPIESRELGMPPIYPFRCNLSQRRAVENALAHSISIIEGPPGTGKTETILNLIANIITSGSATVGVVSFGNSAVDNVREKLAELGFGHLVARLGSKERVQEFFGQQDSRNADVVEFVNQTPPDPLIEGLAELDGRLRRLQAAERDRAELRQQVDAYTLELKHFERHAVPGELSRLDHLPLLRRSSDRILDYLVESELEAGQRRGLVRRVRAYFRYGSLRGLDPDDTATVLRLQRAFYDRRITELQHQLARLDEELRRADLAGLAAEHRGLSVRTLRSALGDRYRTMKRRSYDAQSYRKDFAQFSTDYPVLLSTCHSLRRNLPSGQLLDYLIIDEASQVDLLAAGAALACSRNLVVVGDTRQLPHIADDAARDVIAPLSAYDYNEHSILSSLKALYGEDLSTTLLREHYRCDPSIIGFCNKSSYDGRLVPFTRSEEERPMTVWRTVEGNHMRQHHGGGRSNQREVDVIVNEVIPQDCAGFSREVIGVTTPYRRQANKVTEAFVEAIERIEADTVHKYQGRQKDVMIMTTVLDETWRGRTGLRFVDDPQLINVAVSRAAKRFILVTNHDLLSKSRHIRDLIDYIDYHDLDGGVVDSKVVSMFDLLYRRYSERLRPLAARLRGESRYQSENIAWTVLLGLLDEPQYRHLLASPQVLVRNLLPDVERLSPRQASYVANRASVDFVVYNRVSNRPVLGIEVDGFAFHENKPDQLERDKLKDEILRAYDLLLLRLPTTGSGEEQKIRTALDRAGA